MTDQTIILRSVNTKAGAPHYPTRLTSIVDRFATDDPGSIGLIGMQETKDSTNCGSSVVSGATCFATRLAARYGLAQAQPSARR